MPTVQTEDGPTPTGLSKMLVDMKLNFFEFSILCGFWVAILFISSFIGLEDVLNFPPIAATLSIVGMGSDYLPVTGAVVGLGFMGYMTIKHRAFVSKAVLTIIRKVTRSKR